MLYMYMCFRELDEETDISSNTVLVDMLILSVQYTVGCVWASVVVVC